MADDDVEDTAAPKEVLIGGDIHKIGRQQRAVRHPGSIGEISSVGDLRWRMVDTAEDASGDVVGHRYEVAAASTSQFENAHIVKVGNVETMKSRKGTQPVGVCGTKRDIVVSEGVVGNQIDPGAIVVMVGRG